MKTDPFYSSRAWRALRYEILKRDRWHCVVCQASVRHKGTSRVDHILSRRTHPQLSLDPRNLRTLCTGCDAKRHHEKGGKHRERPEIALDGLPAAWR